MSNELTDGLGILQLHLLLEVRGRQVCGAPYGATSLRRRAVTGSAAAPICCVLVGTLRARKHPSTHAAGIKRECV